MALSGILIEKEGWKLVGEGYKFTEGPIADQEGRVYFTDVPESKVYRIELDGKVTLFSSEPGNPSGLKFGPDGKLYGCLYNKKEIVTFDESGKTTTVATLPSVNDLVIARNGQIYVTDPASGKIQMVKPDGEIRAVAEGLKPNGITLWGDDGTLVVTDGDRPVLWTFRVEEGGSLTNKEKYYNDLRLPSAGERPGSDGMTVDTLGRLYVATAAGLQVFDPTGRMSGVILKPQPKFLSNVGFGGPKFDTLFITCEDKVYQRKVQATGSVIWP